MNRFKIILVLLINLVIYADTWEPAKPFGNISENGEFVIRVIPNKIKGDFAAVEIFKYSGETKSFRSSGVFRLVNTTAPCYVLISNSGDTIVTFDDWGHVGRGDNVIVVYDSAGVVKKKWRLEDFLEEKVRNRLKATKSSNWWREKASFLGPNNIVVQIPYCIQLEEVGISKTAAYLVVQTQKLMITSGWK